MSRAARHAGKIDQYDAPITRRTDGLSFVAIPRTPLASANQQVGAGFPGPDRASQTWIRAATQRGGRRQSATRVPGHPFHAAADRLQLSRCTFGLPL